jgi:multiple sugar transport system permease protein
VSTSLQPDVRVSGPPPALEPAAGRPTRRRRGGRGLAYRLIAPALAFMVVIHLLPTVGGVAISFKNLNTFTFSRLFGAPWNGIENYRAILFDSANPLHDGFVDAVRNSLVYTSTTVAGTLAGGLAIALLLNRRMRGIKAVRTLMLLPWVVPSFVVASLWQFMWQSDNGIVNKILVDYTHLLGHRPVWLIGPNSIWAIVVPSIWRGLPFAMLIFLAGLQAIPRELHEAAAIDGANAWQRFRRITLPLLKPLIAIQLLFNVIYSMYQYSIPTVMMGTNPGPHADLVMTLIVRQSFTNNLFGFGSAASVLLMLVMCVWIAVWYAGFRREFQVAPA